MTFTPDGKFAMPSPIQGGGAYFMGATILEFRGNKKHPVRYAVQLSWEGTVYRF